LAAYTAFNNNVKGIKESKTKCGSLMNRTRFLGFGYQAIPLFAWFYIPVILLYTRHQSCSNIFTVYIVSSISMALAFLGNFKIAEEGPRFPVAWMMFCMCV